MRMQGFSVFFFYFSVEFQKNIKIPLHLEYQIVKRICDTLQYDFVMIRKKRKKAHAEVGFEEKEGNVDIIYLLPLSYLSSYVF